MFTHILAVWKNKS